MPNTRAKFQKQKHKESLLKTLIFIMLSISIISALIFTFFYTGIFSIKNFVIDIQDKTENTKVQKILSDNFAGKNIFLINQKSVEDVLQSNFEYIKRVSINRKWNKDVLIKVTNFQPKFIACESEKVFLLPCMYAEEDGVFYKEAENGYENASLENLYYFETDKRALSFVDESKDTVENRENMDSLAGTRLYSTIEMKNIFALIKYLESSEYKIKNIYIKNLKIIEIDINNLKNNFKLIVSLSKGYDETVKDFKAFTESEIYKQIKDSPDLENIDLSYENKVFYKLKVTATTTDVTTTEPAI